MLHPQRVRPRRPERLRVHEARVAPRIDSNRGLVRPVRPHQVHVGCRVRHIRHGQAHALPSRPSERQDCILRWLSRGYCDGRTAWRDGACHG